MRKKLTVLISRRDKQLKAIIFGQKEFIPDFIRITEDGITVNKTLMYFTLHSITLDEDTQIAKMSNNRIVIGEHCMRCSNRAFRDSIFNAITYKKEELCTY